MRLWDLHRAEGMDPITAMCRVAPLMDRPPAHPSAPDRLELTVPRSAAEAVQDSFPAPAEEVSVTEAYRQRLLAAHRDAERWFRVSARRSWVPDYLTRARAGRLPAAVVTVGRRLRAGRLDGAGRAAAGPRLHRSRTARRGLGRRPRSAARWWTGSGTG